MPGQLQLLFDTCSFPALAKQPTGQDPEGPKALNHAATVTLCWRRKASHFWGTLLLVCGTAEHGTLAIGCRTLCLQSIREMVSGRLLFAPSARNLWAISKDLTNSDSEMRRFESRRLSQSVRSPSRHKFRTRRPAHICETSAGGAFEGLRRLPGLDNVATQHEPSHNRGSGEESPWRRRTIRQSGSPSRC